MKLDVCCVGIEDAVVVVLSSPVVLKKEEDYVIEGDFFLNQ